MLFSSAGIKCTHHRLHQLSLRQWQWWWQWQRQWWSVKMERRRLWCADHYDQRDADFNHSQMSKSTTFSFQIAFSLSSADILKTDYFWHFFLSMIFPHLKNLRCHPCLPSCRHHWTSSYLHLNNKKFKFENLLGHWTPFLSKAAFSFSRTSNRVLSPPGIKDVSGKQVLSFLIHTMSQEIKKT